MATQRAALITGAANGIGRACAIRFAAEGWDLALTDIDEKGLTEVTQTLSGEGVKVETLPADLASLDEIRRVVEAAELSLGRLDVLVNSAGIREIVSMNRVTQEAWDKVFDINVRAPFFLTQAVVPAFRRQGGGRVINIGSVSGLRGLVNRAPYCTSKAAIHGLTRQLAAELSPLNIQVNTVAPGYTSETAMTDLYEDQVIKVMVDSLPAGADRNTPQELANAVYFLASPSTTGINGTVLVVDAGLTETVILNAWPWETDEELLHGPSDAAAGG